MKEFDNLEIAEMTIDHIDDVIIIEKLCFKTPWSKKAFTEELVNNKFARYIVALTNRKVIGYAGFWKILDEGHITNIAVHPEFQGEGVGNCLMYNLIELARKEGLTRLTLEVRAGNLKARSLYKKYGFSDCGIRKGYYSDNNEDAIIMWKNDVAENRTDTTEGGF
ncbi:MAG TPA: ribosomal protein S18-alanine N-acetyltransferase [Clostridiaceae bacterium]|jgi:ribosomal-protein-alanine N-acetyltransferase|nr:ribosomal protein S18-alanine N-acetyltransferase [Clostridiaceae bacterium]